MARLSLASTLLLLAGTIAQVAFAAPLEARSNCSPFTL
jgi:hypothetical protein